MSLFALQDLFRRYREKATGVWTLGKDPGRTIYIDYGDTVFAQSTHLQDRLTYLLVERGKLTQAQMDYALANLKPGLSIGKNLIEMGFITQRDLLEVAKAQVERIVRGGLTAVDLQPEFQARELDANVVRLPMNTPQLFLAGTLSLQDREGLLELLGPLNQVVVLQGRNLMDLTLPPDLAKLPPLLDGTHTLLELSRESMAEPLRLGAFALFLREMGWARLHEMPPLDRHALDLALSPEPEPLSPPLTEAFPDTVPSLFSTIQEAARPTTNLEHLSRALDEETPVQTVPTPLESPYLPASIAAPEPLSLAAPEPVAPVPVEPERPASPWSAPEPVWTPGPEDPVNEHAITIGPEPELPPVRVADGQGYPATPPIAIEHLPGEGEEEAVPVVALRVPAEAAAEPVPVLEAASAPRGGGLRRVLLVLLLLAALAALGNFLAKPFLRGRHTAWGPAAATPVAAPPVVTPVPAQPAPQPEPQPQPEPKPEAKPEPKPESKPEAKPEPDPKPVAKAETRADAKADARVDVSLAARLKALDRGDLELAVRQGLRLSRETPATHYTLRLEIACQGETIQRVPELFKDRQPDLFLRPITFKDGRICYQVLLGRFPTQQAAEKQMKLLPPSFLGERSRPKLFRFSELIKMK